MEDAMSSVDWALCWLGWGEPIKMDELRQAPSRTKPNKTQPNQTKLNGTELKKTNKAVNLKAKADATRTANNKQNSKAI